MNVELIEVHKLLVPKLIRLDSLMSLFGSIIDQSQEYYSFNDGPLIIL